MSIEEELARIEALADAATPGEWTVVSDLPMYAVASSDKHRVVRTPNQNGYRYVRPGETVDTGIAAKSDAAFIADARTSVPRLVAAIRAVLAVDHWCEGGNGVSEGYEACCFDDVRNAVAEAMEK